MEHVLCVGKKNVIVMMVFRDVVRMKDGKPYVYDNFGCRVYLTGRNKQMYLLSVKNLR